MSLQDGELRPWREVAEELAHETDSAKIVELSDELDEALAAQDIGAESQRSDSRRSNPQAPDNPLDI